MVNTEHAAAVETLLAALVLSAIGGHWVAITNAHVVIRGVLTELGPVRMSVVAVNSRVAPRRANRQRAKR